MISKPTPQDWYYIENIDAMDSPALAIYPERILSNIYKMIEVVGDVNRLRPHVKTHKMSEVVQMQIDAGIWKFKCATIAEAEMLGDLEVQDVLIAYQPVGPTIGRVFKLIQKYPQTRFSILVDDQENVKTIAALSQKLEASISVFLDIDVGMHRTGIAPDRALGLYSFCESMSGIQPIGLHAYDGHVHHENAELRRNAAAEVNEIIDKLYNDLDKQLEVVVSGSPSFPYHAERKKYTCSPGTSLLWDWRYGNMCEDQEFLHAAVVIARVISKPGFKYICVDLGHQSIASEMPFPRVHFINLPDATQVKHSEEHLVLEVADNTSIHLGDVLYGIPMHICPTVALHESVSVIEHKTIVDSWEVVARKRKITL